MLEVAAVLVYAAEGQRKGQTARRLDLHLGHLLAHQELAQRGGNQHKREKAASGGQDDTGPRARRGRAFKAVGQPCRRLHPGGCALQGTHKSLHPKRRLRAHKSNTEPL